VATLAFKLYFVFMCLIKSLRSDQAQLLNRSFVILSEQDTGEIVGKSRLSNSWPSR